MSARFAIGLVCVSGVMLIGIRINHAMNYQEVDAEVSSVSSECYLEDKTYMVVAERTKSTRQKWPCTSIQAVQAANPEFAGWQIKGDVTLAFDYISPADQQTHDGTLTFAYADNPDYAGKRQGDTVKILAHDSDPTSYANPD